MARQPWWRREGAQRSDGARFGLEKKPALTQNFCVPPTPLALDDFDHRLLALLQRDADQTLTALGDEVGLSASAVQRRLTRYRKAGLLRQVAVLDPAHLGNVNLVAVLVTMERDSTKQHAAFCARMRAAPEVQQCYSLAGEWDYLVVLAARNVAHYRQLAERLFIDEGTIRRYETHMIFESLKRSLALPTRAEALQPARSRRSSSSLRGKPQR